MSILDSYTLKCLKFNKKRTIVTIIGVVLSCALICGTALLSESFRDMGMRSAISGMGNYHAIFEDVPFEKAKYIEENNAIKTAMVSRQLGFSKVKNIKDPYKQFIYVVEYDDASFKNQPLSLVSGRMPQRSGEIVIPQQIISDGVDNIKIGDNIVLDIGKRIDKKGEKNANDPFSENEKFEPVKYETFKVTGIIKKPSFESSNAYAYSAFSYLDKSKSAADDKVNVSVLAKDPIKIYKTAPNIAKTINLPSQNDDTGREFYNIKYNDNYLRWIGKVEDDNMYESIMAIVFILIAIIMVGSVAVIYNAFSISVSERKKQFGMFISVGATNRQIRKSVFFEAFIIAAIGIPVGILGGIAGISILLSVTGSILKTLVSGTNSIRLVVSPTVILATVFFEVITILISAYIPAKRASMISPIEAIRLNDDVGVKGKKEFRCPKLTKLIFGFEGELALKNLKRNRKKYRTTVFSLFISIVMFLTFSSFMHYSIKTVDQKEQKYDIQILLDKINEIDFSPFINQITSLPQIKEIKTVRSVEGVVKTDKNGLDDDLLKNKKLLSGLGFSNVDISNAKFNINVSISAIGKGAFDQYIKKLGLDSKNYYDVENPTGIFINKNYSVLQDKKSSKNESYQYNILKLNKGSMMNIQEIETSDDIHKKTGIIVGAVDQKVDQSDMEDQSVQIIVSDSVFDSITNKLGCKLSRESILIKSTDNAAVDAQVKKIYTKTIGGTISNFYNYVASKKQNVILFNLVRLFCYGFITLITLIGITNIVNTINTNMQLRRREFAMLKSVGLTPVGFDKMMRCESFFYGIKALLFGIPVSILLSYMIYTQVNKGILKMPFTLPWVSFILCILSVFAIVYCTIIISSKKEKQENIIDSIKEENL